jgi:hypothetical protein
MASILHQEFKRAHNHKKISTHSDLRAGTVSDRILKKIFNVIAAWNVRSLGVCGKLKNIKIYVK